MTNRIIDLPAVIVQTGPLSPLSIEFPGPLVHIEYAMDSTPGIAQVLIAPASPVSGSWRIRRFEVTSRAYSIVKLKKNADIVKVGYTSPVESNLSSPVDPWIEILPTDTISLTYDQTDGPSIPITGRIYYTTHS